ncbi:MAG: hypothetical protein FWB86_01015 [Treponema sp.]|nr:hypothetical protein [Treponema sp.]MCL2250678.1 hypothetical protein [Treponema sp.]
MPDTEKETAQTEFAQTEKPDACCADNCCDKKQLSFEISEAEWTQLKALLDKRYSEIAALLRYNKTKDESIQKISAEIQKYREGFAYSALKPFIIALIALREDCRKSLRDAKQFALDDEKAKKYIDYLVSDFEEMFSNIGLERNKEITMNGKPLYTSPRSEQKLFAEILEGEQKEEETILSNTDKIKNTSELIEYLKNCESAVRLAIQKKSVIDKTLQDYIALASRTDAEHYFALAAPVAKSLYALYDKISEKSKPAGTLSGEQLLKLYHDILVETGKGIYVILTEAEVIIETLKGEFDTQKHKILKTIPTTDESLDRTIVNSYTDCYSFDGKVIYQSKVDVYKLQ